VEAKTMKIQVYLIGDELKLFGEKEGRAAIIERVRTLSMGEDVDKVQIYYGVQSGQVIELAPTSHAKLAARLREMALPALANLIDPEIERDIVKRQAFADEIQNVGTYFGPKDMGV
jgi:hypothetical protein